MLPGKKYKPEDYLRMAWSRKWLIIIPAVLIAATTAAVSVTLPNRYRASTSILIIPQRVPENFVQSTVTAGISERLTVISQQILSRTRLERIIQELDLYKKERAEMIMEDVVTQMRADINVAMNGGRTRRDETNSFSISYESLQARTAMQVTERLASLFVQENLEDRALMADSTSQFLQAQLDDAKRRLIEHESKLEAFRQRNNGQLPSQVQSNLTMLQAAQTQLAATAEAGNRERDQLLALEKSIAEYAATAPTVPAATARTAPFEPGSQATGSASQQLESARTALRGLELRLKPDHPDVTRMKRAIAELEVKADAEALEQPLSGAPTGGAPVLDRAAQVRLNSMRQTADEIRLRLASRKQEEARLQATIGSYTTRIQTAPALESELTELMRDYSTLQESYTSLLKRSEESKIAVNLERRQIGEQFKVLDGARLPEKPFSPDRVRINLLGALGGLAFGLALAGFFEYRDTSIKSDDDVMAALALPVLAVIPTMVTTAERKRLKRRRLVLASSASALGVVVLAMAIAVWRMRLLDSWLR